jgi:hypothetical protein
LVAIAIFVPLPHKRIMSSSLMAGAGVAVGVSVGVGRGVEVSVAIGSDVGDVESAAASPALDGGRV